jgi:hypothetical protein
MLDGAGAPGREHALQEHALAFEQRRPGGIIRHEVDWRIALGHRCKRTTPKSLKARDRPRHAALPTLEEGPMAQVQPVLNQLNIVARDFDATLAFYRRLGVAVPDGFTLKAKPERSLSR